MKRDEVLSRLCSLTSDVAFLFHWQHPADCFCGTHDPSYDPFCFSDKILQFIEDAVKEKVAKLTPRDG
jgi:hypothetical protein